MPTALRRERALAEIRVLRALGPVKRRPRRVTLPRQLQPDGIRLSYFAALRGVVEAARDRVLRAVGQRFAELAATYAPVKEDAAERVDRGEHKGTFLALKVPPAAATELALPGGEPASDLHITLFYAKGLTPDRMALVEQRFREVSAAYLPLDVTVRRLGVFLGSRSSDYRDVLYARPESAKLLDLRAALVARLAQDRIAPTSEHEFRPHITLKYLEPGEPRRPAIAPVRFQVTDFVFASGDPSVRADAIDFNAFFDELANDFWNEWTNTRFADLARSMAGRTAAFQKEQLSKQFRAAFGIDIVKVEPWLQGTIEAFTVENVGLVKSIPAKFFADVESQIVRGMRKGLRWEELAEVIEERTGVAERHAKLVARDQVGKFMGELNEARQRELGVTHFVWRTSRDNRVRESHEALEGQVFAWAEPPVVDGEEATPGTPINCRCEAQPVLDDLISELTGEARGDSPRLDWNEEDIIRVPAGQPGGGQFAGGRHQEQNPAPELGPGVKAHLTKLKKKAAGTVAEHPSKLVAKPAEPGARTPERKAPQGKPLHWLQEETSVQKPGPEYTPQAMNPETGEPYAGETSTSPPASAKATLGAQAPKSEPPAPTKPAPAPPPKPTAKPSGMNPAHKAHHSKLVKQGKLEEASAYLKKFEGPGQEPQPAPPPEPATSSPKAGGGSWAVEHVAVKRSAVQGKLGGEIPDNADLALKANTAESFNAWKGSLSAAQHAVQSDYKGNGYKWMNNALRGNAVTEAKAQELRDLTSALETAPETPHDFVVWRGMRYGKLATDPVGTLADKKGILHDNGFVSTSFDVHTSISFAGGDPKSAVLMRIRLPKGTRMRYWTGEHELLLQRDSAFRIDKVYRTKEGFTVLDGEYIGSSPVGLSQRGAKKDAVDRAAGEGRFGWSEEDFASGGVWIE